MTKRLSLCRNCAAFCPIVVTLDGERVIKVEGDFDAPIYRGFTCPKGRTMPQQHHNPNRLLHSLKRLPDGRRIPISSEQLVEEIAAHLARIIDQYGPNAVATYLGGPTTAQPASIYLMTMFLAAIRSPMLFSAQTIDQPGLVMAQSLHGAWRGGRAHPSQWETFLLVGGNPVTSKQHLPQNPGQQLKALVQAGTRLIVIDPRRTETARMAAVHLQIIPGEDPTVLAGLIHLLFALDGVDRDFVAENAEGLDALRAAVRDFTPDYVAARAGVAREDLLAAVRILIEAKQGDTGLGVGPSMATRGTLSGYLALCIQTLRGFWARAGDPVARPRVLTRRRTLRAQPAAPTPAWGFGRQLPRNLQQTAAGMPTAALPELMLSAGDDRIRALFLHGGAPYTWPQTRKSVQALSATDLLIVHDVELNATSELAHYVIATTHQLEVPAMSQTAEMFGLNHPGYDWTEPYGAWRPAVVPHPPGSDLMEPWQIYYRVARKLGITLDMSAFTGQRGARPLDMTREPTTDDLYEMVCEGSAVPLAAVKEFPHGALFDEARDVVRERADDCAERLQLADATMLAELAGVVAEDPLVRRGTGPDYPFLLIARRVQNSTNSAPRADGLIRTGYNPVYLHPEDMAALDIAAGSAVEIRSRHGAVIGFVEIDRDLRPGVIAVAHGFGARRLGDYDPRRDGANVNELTSWDDDPDPYHGMPRMSAIPVAIHPVIT
jgi:anaerobic selenocysteine-containing dehydrogenase